MLREWILVSLMTLNLSHAPAEGLRHHENIRYNTGVTDNNPFSGARSLSISLERETFTTPKPPIPYAEIWNNGLNQTAQQYVAILSILQSPIPSDYNAILRLKRDYLRLRDRQLIEDLGKQWK